MAGNWKSGGKSAKVAAAFDEDLDVEVDAAVDALLGGEEVEG